MFASKYILPAIFVVSISGCSTIPPEEDISRETSKQITPRGEVLQDYRTNLDDVLDCIGEHVAKDGRKRFFVANDTVNNAIKDVPDTGRIFLTDAFSRLVDKSNGRISFAGYYDKMNSRYITELIDKEGINKGDQDLPPYLMQVDISQYEKDIQRSTRDADIRASKSSAGNSQDANVTVLGAHFTLLDAQTRTLKLKGISTHKIITIAANNSASGLMLGFIQGVGLGFNTSVQKREGVGAALSQLMKAGVIDIVGQFYQDDFDYRVCAPKNRSTEP